MRTEWNCDVISRASEWLKLRSPFARTYSERLVSTYLQVERWMSFLFYVTYNSNASHQHSNSILVVCCRFLSAGAHQKQRKFAGAQKSAAYNLNRITVWVGSIPIVRYAKIGCHPSFYLRVVWSQTLWICSGRRRPQFQLLACPRNDVIIPLCSHGIDGISKMDSLARELIAQWGLAFILCPQQESGWADDK